MTKIKLLQHAHFGRARFYPGCPLSTAICMIGGGKTITNDQAEILAKIGKCEISVKPVEERPISRKGK